MSSSSEEEDYMSESFITKSAEIIAPGLPKIRSLVRENEILAKKRKQDEEYRQKHLSKKQLEEKNREVGLNKPIPSSNKGFAMLAKMGYKPGDSIGGQSSSGEGIREPIGITLKTDRSGLGVVEHLEQIKRRRKNNDVENKIISTDEFRQRFIDKENNRQINSNLIKCQRVCVKLDTAESIIKPEYSWFWPEEPKSNEDDEDLNDVTEIVDNDNHENNDDDDDDDDDDDEGSDEEYEPSEKLSIILNHLRTKYFFCHWCGSQFDDENDLITNCPGISKDDH